MGVGTLADMDQASFEVSYLSPTVMTYLDAGSDFCAGAHPDDHSDYYNVDVRTGKPLDLSLIFKDWVAMDEESGDIVPAATARLHPDHYTWKADDKAAGLRQGAPPATGCQRPRLRRRRFDCQQSRHRLP